MTYDRSEFLAGVAKQVKQRNANMLPVARIVQAAGVVMHHLTTDDEHWNRFLSYLQGLVDRYEQARVHAQGKIGDPTVWGDSLLKLKTDIIEAEASIRLLRVIMELPKAIIEGGEQAQEIIAKLEKKNEAAGQTQS